MLAMPRFYFDTYDDDRAVPDSQGIVLGDLKEAKKKAIKALPDTARDGRSDGDFREFAVDVLDEEGRRRYGLKGEAHPPCRVPA